MNTIKVVKNRNYTTISNVILRDKNLSLKAKGLLVTVLGLPDDWDFTIQGISAVLKEGRESISSAIQELIERGYCVRENQRAEGGQYVGYDYTFSEHPFDAEKPATENPVQVNPTQLNKQRELNKQKNIAVEEIFNFWKSTMNLNGGTILTPNRKKAILARLREGYTVERLKRAVIGCSLSPYHQGQNDQRTKYNDITLICRSGEKVEFFEQKNTPAPAPSMNIQHIEYFELPEMRRASED